MEVLRFDSRTANAKYSPLIDMLKGKLSAVPVLAQTASVKRLPAAMPFAHPSFEAGSKRATA
jgi:hypothetical protein